ncbi:hypothetical protein PHLGIDRAFT_362449 [Phlebiopsis gigantea 11061_1 CR5-6]|uniref:Uncharacterized protein n=1 Tax=Phlebiopsis gigantea (strain 11061_1 CR5-6) TaxID=745531 RepID=A0A0C3S1J9_PHLG1|nr:hypothetical protein PHLGIDRAFT_362449 [Phlebiopsis gigantea 11061_1 CR5-6]
MANAGSEKGTRVPPHAISPSCRIRPVFFHRPARQRQPAISIPWGTTQLDIRIQPPVHVVELTLGLRELPRELIRWPPRRVASIMPVIFSAHKQKDEKMAQTR